MRDTIFVKLTKADGKLDISEDYNPFANQAQLLNQEGKRESENVFEEIESELKDW